MHDKKLFETLVELSRLDDSPYSADLPEGFEIRDLLDLCAKNGIFLLACEKLKDHPRTRKQISSLEAVLAYKKMLLASYHLEFDLLAKRFAMHEIPFIPLKGIILARLIWPKRELRQMSDIDIFLAYDDAAKAKDVLDDMHYVQNFSDPQISEPILPLLADKKIARHIDAVEFKRADFNLEIHFRLLSSKILHQVDPVFLFKESLEIKSEGHTLQSLSIEHQLMHISTHATYHNFAFGLRPIAEIDALTRTYVTQTDWGKFIKTAVDSSLVNLAYIPLYLARSFFGSPIPDKVIFELEKHTDKPIAGLGHRLREEFLDRDRIPILSDSSLFLQMAGQRDMLKSICRVFFPSAKFLKLKKAYANKPNFLVYIEYPKRFFRLLWTYLPLIGKKLFFSRGLLYGRYHKAEKR